MNTLPSIPYTYTTTVEIADDFRLIRAVDGTARMRGFYTAAKHKYNLVWDQLTAADKGTLEAFYNANRGQQISFTALDDGVTRTCYVTGWKPTPRKGSRWSVEMKLEEA